MTHGTLRLHKKSYRLFAIIFTLIILFSVGFSFGQTWDGSESSDWNTPDNWVGGSVPNGGNVTIPSSGVTFMPVINVDPINTINDITVQSGATLTQTGGTFTCGALLVNGTFNQSGGTLLSDQDLKVEDGGVLDQSGTAVIQLLAPDKGVKFKEKNVPLGGGSGTQSGNAIIQCKDFKLETSNCSFTQSGNGLITLNHDWKNLGTFVSLGGTVQFNGVAGAGADFSVGTNQFYNIVIDDAANPKFDNDPNTTIRVGGSWTNNSSITSLTGNNTTVEFNGLSAQTVGGTVSTTFNNLTISNFSGDVNLDINITVQNLLSFSSGILYTGSNMLTLGSSTGILLGEAAGRYVVGHLTTTKFVGTASSIFGNIGVWLSTGLDNLGNVTVTRVTGPDGIITSNQNSGIARNWIITSTNPPVNGRNITYSWNSDDDNGVDLTFAIIFKNSGLDTSWFPTGNAEDVSSTRSITLENTTDFLTYTIGDENFPLPVELTSFTAKINENSAHLSWKTKTEVNNQGFEIERMADRNWERIAFVEGHGTTTETNNYSFVDASLKAGQYAYRLKQLNFNGSFQYSDVINVEITKPFDFMLFQNHPNPFNPTTTIKFQIQNAGLVSLIVYDILGNKVATLVNEKKEPGNYNISYNASNLSSGTYIYQLRMDGFVQTKKLILIK
jgi:Secretion system C-terminal sorting domain